ncbi:OmpA family protein [Pontibacter sp. MBLB2868]|uniref:OmpA family protein n=1 Tax=Pontibacter sp. MBLB2868 TaxID=3451555 RepID=UPI003F74FA3E
MNNLNRMFPRILLFLPFFWFFTQVVLAQSTGSQLRAGKKLFEKENYREAIPYFERVLANDPDNVKVLYKAGISYMAFDKEKSIDYLDRAQELNPKIDRELQFWLGKVYHINYRFDEAIEYFKSYQAKLTKREEDRSKEVDQLIQHALNAKKEVASPKDVFVKNLGGTINTAYSEHSPVISSDYNYLLFTSRGEKATGKEAIDGEFYEDIFETRRISGDEWEQTRVVSGSLNSTGHDASIQLFDHDTKMLLYRSDKKNNSDIMVSERQPDGTWGAPESISDKVNTHDFESDAFITPDGKTLYYSTNHYSAKGDLDIYMVQRNKNGTWGEPKSLGQVINTPYDDDSPFLAQDGTLFFSSKGHNTMGGFDIFSSKYDSVARRWSTPENMGTPINTPDDDTYYRLSPDGSYAYLSSYRIGGYGEKDIYTINYIRKVEVKGQLFTEGSNVPVQGMELVFKSEQADRKLLKYQDFTSLDSARFNVSLLSGRTYEVEVRKEGEVVATLELDVPMVLNTNTSLVHNFYLPQTEILMATLDTDTVSSSPEVLTDLQKAEAFVFENLLFNTDSFMLRPESKDKLDEVARILMLKPELKISLEGHTDSRASSDYNNALSRNRVKAAYNYLIKQGVAPERMQKVSFGKDKPSVPNASASNMQLNRRVEIRVIHADESDLADHAALNTEEISQ